MAALLDGIGEAMILLDSQGRIALVNRAMEELTGRERSHLAGCRPADLEGSGVWLPPTLRRCLDSGQRQTLIQEVKGRRLALTAAPLPGGWVLATARDITELDRLQRLVERMEQERERSRHELAGPQNGPAARDEMVAVSPAMQQVLALARRVAAVDSTILLLGESGVGKGVLAREIHRASPRRTASLVKVDCAALPESLLESELFGYAPGSFTGARREGKAGIIEQANRGTLFLDEIGDLPLSLQVKLLHVIQERRFTRVGAVAPIQVDFRIVAATHRNLESLVAEGRFREDLFYRLNVVPIRIPPLRERPEEIPALVGSFLERFAARYRVEKVISPGAMAGLMAHRWPGNVRELENLVERLVVTVEEREIRPEHLPPEIVEVGLAGAGKAGTELSATGILGASLSGVGLSGAGSPIRVDRVIPLKEAMEALVLELVGVAYREYGSSVKVGRALGIHQTTAARKIREWKARRGQG